MVLRVGVVSMFFLHGARKQRQTKGAVPGLGPHRLLGPPRGLRKFCCVNIQGRYTLLDLCVPSLRRGHANLLCIVPILTDDPRRKPAFCCECHIVCSISFLVQALKQCMVTVAVVIVSWSYDDILVVLRVFLYACNVVGRAMGTE